jgi:hypothetical protein
VEDLADIICLAARFPLPPTLLGEPCNVATGAQMGIADLAQTFRKVLIRAGLTFSSPTGRCIDVAVTARRWIA